MTRRRTALDTLRQQLAGLEAACEQRAEGHPALAAAFVDALALGRRDLDDEDVRFVLHQCAATWPELDEAAEPLAAWRAHIARKHPVVERLRDVPFGVWRAWTTHDDHGHHTLHAAAVGLERATEQPLDALVASSGHPMSLGDPEVFAGWRLEDDDQRVLIVALIFDAPAATQLHDDAVEAQQQLGRPGPTLSPLALLTAIADLALLAGLDMLERLTADLRFDDVFERDSDSPDDEFDPFDDEYDDFDDELDAFDDNAFDGELSEDERAAELADVLRLQAMWQGQYAAWMPGSQRPVSPDDVAHAVGHWLDLRAVYPARCWPHEDDPPLGWWREIVATAHDELDLASLCELIAARRDLEFLALGRKRYDRGAFARELPVSTLLETLCGARDDASMSGPASDEALRRAPCAALRLPAGHPAIDTLAPTAPIAAALRWAEQAGTTLAAERHTLELAWTTLRAERRWLATWDRDPGAVHRHPRVVYAHLAHALEHLFDPALRATPLARLGLSTRYRNRVARLGERLEALPPRSEDFPVGTGGARTETALAVALLDLMHTWRGALHTPSPPLAHPDEVRSGLEALGALFDTPD